MLQDEPNILIEKEGRKKNSLEINTSKNILISHFDTYRNSIKYFIKNSTLLCVTDYIDVINAITTAAIIARIDSNAVSVSRLIVMLQGYTNPVNISLLSPSFVMIGKELGKFKQNKVGSIVQQSWLAGVVIGLPVTLLFQSSLPKTILVNVLGQSSELSAIAAAYFKPYSFSIIPQLWLIADANFLQAIGNQKALLFWNTFDAATNIALHYLVIRGELGLGIAGAGYAALAQSCLSVLARRIHYLLDRQFQPYQLYVLRLPTNFSSLKKIFKLGLPRAVQAFINNIIFNILNPMVGRLGSDRLIIEDTANKYFSLIIPIFTGVKKSIGKETANLIGNKQYPVIRLLGNTGLLAQASLGLIPLFSLAVFPTQLMKLYIGDESFNKMQDIKSFIRLAFVSNILANIIITLADTNDMILQSFGDTLIPSIYSALIMLSCLLPTSYLMGFIFEWDLIGLNIAAGISFGLTSLCHYYRWNSHIQVGQAENQNTKSLAYNPNAFFKQGESSNTEHITEKKTLEIANSFGL